MYFVLENHISRKVSPVKFRQRERILLFLLRVTIKFSVPRRITLETSKSSSSISHAIFAYACIKPARSTVAHKYSIKWWNFQISRYDARNTFRACTSRQSAKRNYFIIRNYRDRPSTGKPACKHENRKTPLCVQRGEPESYLLTRLDV